MHKLYSVKNYQQLEQSHLNGTAVANPDFATNTLTLAGLNVGETYTVDIVGAKDKLIQPTKLNI